MNAGAPRTESAAGGPGNVSVTLSPGRRLQRPGGAAAYGFAGCGRSAALSRYFTAVPVMMAGMFGAAGT